MGIIRSTIRSIIRQVISPTAGLVSNLLFIFLGEDDTEYTATLTFREEDGAIYYIPKTFLDADDTSYSL